MVWHGCCKTKNTGLPPATTAERGPVFGVKTMPDRTDDDQLIDRILAGDTQAFDTVWDSYGSRLTAVARRMTRNDHDADEAVQDALLSAYQALPRFQRNSRLSTWLHRIVVNAALMLMRRRQRRHEVSYDDLESVDGESRWEPAELADLSDGPLRAAERAEAARHVRGLIAALPDVHRTVLELRDLEERSTAETAAALGISKGAVKTRLHRARQALRELFTSGDDAFGGMAFGT